MQLLRRILTGLVMALVALLPGPSHALSAAGGIRSALPHVHAGTPAAAGHDRHAGSDCAAHHGHGSHAPPCRHPCESCAMACCAPVILGLAVPFAGEAMRVLLVRRSLPLADRRYADASPAERLRPPIRL